MVNLSPLKKYFLSSAVITTALCMNSCTHKGNDSIAGKTDFSDTAVSTVSLYKDAQGREVLVKNNTLYDIVEYHDSVGAKKVLLKITKAEKGFIDSANTESHFIVSATNITTNKPGWTKEFPGTDVDYSTKVLVAHTEGHNQNEEDTYTQYSLTTGEKLMTYTYAPLSVMILGDGRFMGYLSQQSSTEKPEGFAVVSYVSRDQVIDKVKIKLKGGDTTLPAYTPELKMRVAQESGNTLSNEGKTVIMGHVDKGFSAKDINNFAMEINFTPKGASEPIFILLPIRDDRLDIANATYDKKLFELSKAN